MMPFLKLLAAAGLALLAAATPIEDWTQFGGPRRDFTVNAKPLAATWPSSGPRVLWRRTLGEGFSPVATEGRRVFTMYQKGEYEVAVAMDSATGATIWEQPYAAPITEKMSHAPGPRSTPLVTGDAVFTAGATGKLHRLNKATGRVEWSHDLFTEFNGHVQDEYYAASPLAYGETIIVPVGGPGASVVAFHQRTGSVLWKALDFKISYASPILIDVDGQPQVVLMMESEIIGIDPATGALLWQHPHANITKTNVSTPLWSAGNLLFCSSAYNSGGRMLRLTRKGSATTVEELWYSRDLRLHVANPVRVGDTLYGSNGDFGPYFFSAVDVMTGRLRWRLRDFVKAWIVYADEKFIILNEDGELLLASPAADGLQIHAKAQLLTKTAWTPPSIGGTILYARDRKEIVAVDLH